ncbi:putative serine protease EDA2 [Artemisia annua]|uniref:Putative serine protease EDA2 n=1 Tax=Artemisia annua TaxID=35608 RepID=A0A2U1KJT7_ARTAN|nr:putative serine protease EDA2 [Artemisia annua]
MRLRGIGIGASEGPISLDDFRNLQRSNTFQEKDEKIEAEGANYLLEMMRCIREVNVENNIVGCNVPAYMITCGNCGHGADLRGFPQSPLFLEGNSKNCSSPDAGFCEGIFEEMSKQISGWIESDEQGIMTRPGPEDARTYDRNGFHLNMFLSKDRRV